MTPQDCIRELDAGLKAVGNTAQLVRPEGGLADLTCRASFTHFAPAEFVGSIKQGDRVLILSPTDLAPVGWLDVEEGDQVAVGAQWFRVEASNLKRIADTPVRVELHLRGM